MARWRRLIVPILALVFSWPVAMAMPVAAQAEQLTGSDCRVERSTAMDFTGSGKNDTLSVKVDGNPCSQARVTISLKRADGVAIYHYVGELIEHMPFLIYEPDIIPLVNFFISKVLSGAIGRVTSDLPVYTGVDSFYESTNDFVIVTIEEYEALRQRHLPILWHTTGESTWVHVVYDPETQLSQVIMRGGVF